jgi:CheY-like chemotaxis protein
MRVLYIDDDRVNTLLFVETCRLGAGIELETAASGAEALEIVGSWTPDLLVVDLHLPDTTGFALLPALRARAGQPTLPAILCTADTADMVAAPAQAAGFDDCWTKPVQLRQVMAELARRSRPADSAP